MDDVYLFVFKIIIGLLAIELLLYRHIRRQRSPKNAEVNNEIKGWGSAGLVVFLLFIGWLFFFKDKTYSLECRQETMRCAYYHTTEFNPENRLSKEYDISQISHAETKRHYRRRGGSFYTVKLIGENTVIDLPPHHVTSGMAQREADRFNRFLREKEDRYILREDYSSSFNETVVFMGSLFILFIEIRLFWVLVEAAFFKKHEEPKPRRRKKRSATPAVKRKDNVIQRKDKDE